MSSILLPLCYCHAHFRCFQSYLISFVGIIVILVICWVDAQESTRRYSNRFDFNPCCFCWCSWVWSSLTRTRRSSPLSQLPLQLWQQPRVHLPHHHRKGEGNQPESRELLIARWRLSQGICVCRLTRTHTDRGVSHCENAPTQNKTTTGKAKWFQIQTTYSQE